MSDRRAGQRGRGGVGGQGLEGARRAQVRWRWPELTVGLMVVGLSALAGVWLHDRSVARSPVLALRADVARGEVLDAADLRVVEIGVEEAVNVVPADRAVELEGRVALSDLSAGTLVSPDQFAAGSPVGAGQGVVGLALDPGGYPLLTLRPGDVVRVVATPGTGSVGAGPVVLVEGAVVVDVAAVGGQDQLFVSLSMPVEAADAVAAADADGRARLIQVPGGDGSS